MYLFSFQILCKVWIRVFVGLLDRYLHISVCDLPMPQSRFLSDVMDLGLGFSSEVRV